MNPDGSIADNLTVGNQIVIFDSQTPYEGYTDMACVKSRVEESGQLRVKIELAELSDCSTPYSIQGTYLSDHDGVGNDPWDFSSGNSAGVCDLNAGFFEADVSDLSQPFSDGFVSFKVAKDGSGVVPYLPEPFFGVELEKIENTARFHQIWFSHTHPFSLSAYL